MAQMMAMDKDTDDPSDELVTVLVTVLTLTTDVDDVAGIANNDDVDDPSDELVAVLAALLASAAVLDLVRIGDIGGNGCSLGCLDALPLLGSPAGRLLKINNLILAKTFTTFSQTLNFEMNFQSNGSV